MSLVLALLGALRAALRSRTDLTLENLALRQQLALLRRQSKRPQFGRLDRLLWMWLCTRWAGWRDALHVVRPETVIRWRRQGFRAFWTWKSRHGRTGRPSVGSELAALVRTMALANPLWGAPRIHGELLKLGLGISQRTVARLMPRRPKPPSQTWRTFLKNHLADLVSVDFLLVPTACGLPKPHPETGRWANSVRAMECHVPCPRSVGRNARGVQNPHRPHAREPGAPATACPAPRPIEATAIRAPRSPPLGMALKPVGWVAKGAPSRSPRDSDSLAPAGLPRFLDFAFWPDWLESEPAEDTRG